MDVPFHHFAVDLIGPIMPVSDNGNRYILTIVDFAKKYPEAVALRERVALNSPRGHCFLNQYFSCEYHTNIVNSGQVLNAIYSISRLPLVTGFML